jgi:general stress protein 26
VNLRDLYKFIDKHGLAVQASVSPEGGAQASVVGVIVTEGLELFFDTVESSRKCHNLRRNPKIALVIGWDHDQTVQYEGIADEPRRSDLSKLKELYFERFPDGTLREGWPGIAYFRVRPTWIRYTDFRGAEPKVVEFGPRELVRIGSELV